MKKLFILVLINIVFTYPLKAQQCVDMQNHDVYTPKNTPVLSWILCELPNQETIDNLDSYFTQRYPEAILLYHSTNKYNCHGYAWLKEKTGMERWIGKDQSPEETKQVEKFMNDSSYIEVPREVAISYSGKVFWNRPMDHSAITTNHPDTVISKWANGPLMKHHIKDCPYDPFYYGVKYYLLYTSIPKPPSPPKDITGPDLIPCSGTASYSIAAEGMTSISWSVFSSGLQIVSGQGTNTITIRQAGSGISQSTVIRVSGNLYGTSIDISKTISVGARYVTSLTAGSKTFSPGSSIQFTASPAFPASEGDYEWMVYPSAGVTLSTWRHTNYITFPGGNSYYTVGVRSISACTTPGTWTTVTVNSGSSASAQPVFSVSAEQSNSVKITFDSSISTTSQTFTWQLSNALTGTAVTSGQIASSGEVLNFSQFPTGIYLLQINTGNGRTETQKVVLK